MHTFTSYPASPGMTGIRMVASRWLDESHSVPSKVLLFALILNYRNFWQLRMILFATFIFSAFSLSHLDSLNLFPVVFGFIFTYIFQSHGFFFFLGTIERRKIFPHLSWRKCIPDISQLKKRRKENGLEMLTRYLLLPV